MKHVIIAGAMLLMPATVLSQSATLTMAELSLSAAVWELDQARGVSYDVTDAAVKDMQNRLAKRVNKMRAENKSCLLIKREIKQLVAEKIAMTPEAEEYPASVAKVVDAMADYAAAWCLNAG